MKRCIIVLGSPNDEQGNLSTIALSRLRLARDLYLKERSYVLCTGGFGPNFNTSKHPHALYAKRFLVENEVVEADFLTSALSQNTVEDAQLSLIQIRKTHLKHITIFTSDYHLPRSKFIFDKLFTRYQLKYAGADSSHLNESMIARLETHETKALKTLKERGLIIDGKILQ